MVAGKMESEGKLSLVTVSADAAGSRLDRFLHRLYPEIPVNRWRRVLAVGRVRVDGRPAAKGTILAAGQRVEFPGDLPQSLNPVGPRPEPGELEIVYADNELVAVNKPAGCHTHPLRPEETGTLANRLAAAFPELVGIGGFGPLQPGLLNRLDFATSGLVLAARSNPAWKRFRAEFAAHRVRKEYLGLAEGRLAEKMVVDAELIHDPADSRKMRVADSTSDRRRFPAVTEIIPLACDPAAGAKGLTLVRLVMFTGVMHQLRVHLAHAGHPLAGDRLYGAQALEAVNGKASPSADFFHLHCQRMTFPSGRVLSAPEPPGARARTPAFYPDSDIL